MTDLEIALAAIYPIAVIAGYAIGRYSVRRETTWRPISPSNPPHSAAIGRAWLADQSGEIRHTVQRQIHPLLRDTTEDQ